MIKVEPIPAFTDNYIWCLYDDQSLEAMVVDPGDASPVFDWIEKAGLTLVGIIITHHHADHTGGLNSLLSQHAVPVYGPENPKIGQITQRLTDGDSVSLLGCSFAVIAVPGHTLDHIAFYASAEDILFCGDTLFAGGCGRVFEGDAEMMLSSLNKLASLPEKTSVYCAHEYTMANLRFAHAVEPGNEQLNQRINNDQLKRDQDLPTVPSTIAIELQTNPFLRCEQSAVIAAAAQQSGNTPTNPVDTFAVIRGWKDGF